jgi:hypothetical protein
MATFRDELIRAHFEAHRELTWAEMVEPRLREQGVGGEQLASYREQWNQHFEKRDWGWWQNEAKRFSNAVLDDMRMDCLDKLDMLGMLQWQRNKAASEQDRFQQVLNGTLDKEVQPPEQARDKGREM